MRLSNLAGPMQDILPFNPSALVLLISGLVPAVTALPMHPPHTGEGVSTYLPPAESGPGPIQKPKEPWTAFTGATDLSKAVPTVVQHARARNAVISPHNHQVQGSSYYISDPHDFLNGRDKHLHLPVVEAHGSTASAFASPPEAISSPKRDPVSSSKQKEVKLLKRPDLQEAIFHHRPLPVKEAIEHQNAAHAPSVQSGSSPKAAPLHQPKTKIGARFFTPEPARKKGDGWRPKVATRVTKVTQPDLNIVQSSFSALSHQEEAAQHAPGSSSSSSLQPKSAYFKGEPERHDGDEEQSLTHEEIIGTSKHTPSMTKSSPVDKDQAPLAAGRATRRGKAGKKERRKESRKLRRERQAEEAEARRRADVMAERGKQVLLDGEGAGKGQDPALNKLKTAANKLSPTMLRLISGVRQDSNRKDLKSVIRVKSKVRKGLGDGKDAEEELKEIRQSQTVNRLMATSVNNRLRASGDKGDDKAKSSSNSSSDVESSSDSDGSEYEHVIVPLLSKDDKGRAPDIIARLEANRKLIHDTLQHLTAGPSSNTSANSKH